MSADASWPPSPLQVLAAQRALALVQSKGEGRPADAPDGSCENCGTTDLPPRSESAKSHWCPLCSDAVLRAAAALGVYPSGPGPIAPVFQPITFKIPTVIPFGATAILWGIS